MSFENLGLSAALLHAVRSQGYKDPTAIQSAAIPVVLAGDDLMAAAQTGTGKTAGFTLPLLQRLSAAGSPPSRGRPVRALILTPTRELAAQVQRSVADYGSGLPLRSAVVFGGVGIHPQINALRRGVDVLVATPGRLLDHLRQRTVDLAGVEILVLDEADRMLDMGFIHDIRAIIAATPKTRQTLMFSATFSEPVRKLSEGLLNRPRRIEVSAQNSAAHTVHQRVHPVAREKKRELLSALIRKGDWPQVLVFTRTKHGANRLATQLDGEGLTATAIHGNKSQTARMRALGDFKRGRVRVLVATDVAARGLDIDHLPHVVNFDLPEVPEDYVHRIGRTGRAGRQGEARSLVCVDETPLLKGIERLLKRPIEAELIPGFEPHPSEKPQPIRNARRGGGRRPDSERPHRAGRRPAGGYNGRRAAG